MVLLKNEEDILPLSKDKKYAVIGQMAKKPRHQGAGSSLVNPIKLDNAYDSMFSRGINITYAEGYALTKKEAKNKTQDAYINEAVNAAKNADIALVFVGLTDVFESEGFDRSHLRIPPEHVALIEAVKNVNSNVVLVLAGGAVVEMPWEDNAKAILHSFLGGEAGGSAVVDLLFGDVNPSGKLAETYPYALEDTPCYDYFPGNTTTVEYREGIFIGYRYYDTAKKDVRYPFGYGLSYSDFDYKDCEITQDKDNVYVKLYVTNTSDIDGDEVVQVYYTLTNPRVKRPIKKLCGFKRVNIKAFETKEVLIAVEKSELEFYDVTREKFTLEINIIF